MVGIRLERMVEIVRRGWQWPVFCSLLSEMPTRRMHLRESRGAERVKML
jgi:hypothetical protein